MRGAQGHRGHPGTAGIAAQHPAIREVAVFGAPHERWGDTPFAAVILRGVATATAAELREWVNERGSARHKRVSEVVILSGFPRSAAGKTLKRRLREPCWAGRAIKV